ncbi:RNA methyltransferase [Candidatus Aminicenantes bacterium AC-708-M15]|jgi:TrmH family RNA methyltransferase|nr:RNA methyltransferase [SCandidatus Aminicenantes bacterium Aminicenantia_JdfR_composite]MCP2597628.1 RNA methyltransferase [Candidatus Aminicenantes bacterium AC-335-G13]MCP2598204.1 RNA methyltransferase [Candidatus Aminicenantes bacterium AC-335-L06]MCP2603963.1 RNA methyltransferase [Candidatus Aminicenantes bacterium AC-708-M15]MCP2605581.1 RNA methyltransferase [Candidatus Aminicenantes bacterium AC-335-O07]
MLIISSRQNQKIKEIRKLINKSKKERIFLLEGTKIIKEALDLDYEFIYLVISSDYIEKNKAMISLLEKKGLSFIPVTSDVLSYLSKLETQPGILGLIREKKYHEDINRGNIFLLIDELQDPGNLGTIFRIAQGFSVDTIYLSKNSVSPFNPKVIRASMGAVLRIKFFDEIDTRKKIQEFRDSGIKIYGTDPHKGKNLNEIKFDFPLVLIVGNESRGISDEIKKFTHENIRIPIEKKLDSLNVAVATGIILYEIKNKLIRRNDEQTGYY